ncbi:hypothetical protein K488DRAFT_70741 [Vararia minispora EC-137]|uniref:Uncharacterized protein n=1 Tax=Vararia minispora EC-137 TaxID=1314806 RepID=A0ACB8QLV0_9AGAM|nr:hypothetical protein K488DRAFT_70741 [Vararia minispora EC-137]
MLNAVEVEIGEDWRYEFRSYTKVHHPTPIDYECGPYCLARWHGRVIEQDIWKPSKQFSRTVNVQNARLRPPIWFICEDDTIGAHLGVPAAKVLNGNPKITSYQLRAADEPAPIGSATSAVLRMKLRGLPREYKRQIRLRDGNGKKITRQKLLDFVARAVRHWHLFLEAKDGLNNPGGLQLDHVIVIGLVNVSLGSWQPLLLYADSPVNTIEFRP